MKIRIMIYIILGYFFFAGFMYYAQRSLIYFPDTNKPNIESYGHARGYSPIQTQTSDGLVIEGWFHPPANDEQPVIIWFHGNAQSHASRAYWTYDYVQEGYGVLLAGYRGYGGNPGKPTEQGLYKDAEAWVNTIVNDFNIEPQRIVLYGESLGSGVAVEMASRIKTGALVLHAPYTSVSEVAYWKFPILPVPLMLKDKFDSLSKIKKVEAPLLILHGAKDKVIPIRYGKKLFSAANQDRTFVEFEKAGHSDFYEYGASEKVMQFLQRNMQN